MTRIPPTPAAIGKQFRSVTIEREALASRAAGDERIPIALSSETPVRRWFGSEILDHSAAAVDLSRASAGLPLLVDHDTGDQVGRILDLAIGPDGMLRGMMRFSRSPRGQEIRQDVEDGIRIDASIGYQIDALVLETSDKQTGDTYRATKWTPLEGSLVAVPADPSVGVNRGADDGRPTPVPIARIQERPRMTAPSPTQAADDRVADLAALARSYNATDLLPKWLERGSSVEDARTELLQRLTPARPLPTPDFAQRDWADMDGKQGKSYSFTRALLDASEGRGGPETERTQQLARELKRPITRHTILLPVMELGKRIMTTTGVGTGKELVPQEIVGHIDPLRNAMRVAQLGATVLPGLSGNADFTKQTTDVTLAWMGENPGAGVTASDIGTALVSLRPKTAMASHIYTRQQLTMGTPESEQLARQSFIAVHALGLDKAAIQGTGAANQPTGILNTAGIGIVALGANGAAPDYSSAVDLITAVKASNAAVGPMGFLSTPGIEGKLRKTQEFSGTNGVAVWRGGDEGEVAGYRAYSSNQVPSDLVKGTSSDCHAILFGAWQELIIGLWGVLEIIVDPYTQAGKGLIVVTSLQMVDIQVKHAEAFAAIKDARTV